MLIPDNQLAQASVLSLVDAVEIYDVKAIGAATSRGCCHLHFLFERFIIAYQAPSCGWRGDFGIAKDKVTYTRIVVYLFSLH